MAAPTPEQLATLRKVYAETGSYARAGEAIDKPRNYAHAHMNKEARKASRTARAGKSRPVQSAPEQKIERNGDTVTAKGPNIQTLDQLLAAADVDLDVWRVKSWTSNTWQGFHKTQTGEAKPVQLWQVKALLERAPEIPDWLRGPGPIRVVLSKPAPRPSGRPSLTLVLGDAHIGFERIRHTETILPYHDERCLSLAVRLVKDLRPVRVVINGDMLDLAALSLKFARTPEQRYLMQRAADRAVKFLTDLREAGPDVEIVFNRGNHEDRLEKYLIAVADELLLLQGPDGKQLLSISSLLGLDQLGIRYTDEVRVGNCRIRHEPSKAGGSFCAIAGHMHTAAESWRTLPSIDGPVSLFAVRHGVSCHIDGRVPGNNLDQPDWQQGFYLLWEHSDGTLVPQSVPVRDGLAFVGGDVYRCD